VTQEVAMDTLQGKQFRLEARLGELKSVLIAYSGGVDSAYLAWCARQVMGLKMLAVLADSPSLARSQFAEAVAFAGTHHIPLKIIETSEMEKAEYVKNDLSRCFHCKNELFTKMEEAREQLGFEHLAYGMNVDDRRDFRPGQTAAQEHGVLAPLVDADLTKADIRQLAREAGLELWDKPASACLSSRIAYGNPVTHEALHRVEKGEDYLRGLGLRQFRVRDHAGLARLEVSREEVSAILNEAQLKSMAEAFKNLGFTYTTLDCEGFRSGSMNEGSVYQESSQHASRLS
jgi:uncharacterized protein